MFHHHFNYSCLLFETYLNLVSSFKENFLGYSCNCFQSVQFFVFPIVLFFVIKAIFASRCILANWILFSSFGCLIIMRRVLSRSSKAILQSSSNQLFFFFSFFLKPSVSFAVIFNVCSKSAHKILTLSSAVSFCCRMLCANIFSTVLGFFCIF